MSDRVEAIIFPNGLETAWADQTRIVGEAIDFLCDTVGGKTVTLRHVWWCVDEREDHDIVPCWDPQERDERRQLCGLHQRCGWRWITPEADDE